jgi:hypothetical protein
VIDPWRRNANIPLIFWATRVKFTFPKLWATSPQTLSLSCLKIQIVNERMRGPIREMSSSDTFMLPRAALMNFVTALILAIIFLCDCNAQLDRSLGT